MQAAFAALLALAVIAPAAQAEFGVSAFQAAVQDNAGNEVTQAGSHPYNGITDFTLNTTDPVTQMPDGQVKNIRVDLPPGLISNPEATPKCSDAQYPACPANTWIGNEDFSAAALPTQTYKVYNMVPKEGQVSLFSFDSPLGRTDIVGGVRDTSDYGLFFTISNVPQVSNLRRSKLTFFGIPADRNAGGGARVPFITLPTACAGIQTTKLTVESYAGETRTATSPTSQGASGCELVPFAPSIGVTPDTTQQDKPVGPAVNLHVPQPLNPDGIESAHVKDAVVTLPPGLTLNPAAATGLVGCTDAQFGIGTGKPVACPAASKVGTVSILSPVLSAPLTGSVYLGQPLADNPFRIFVVAEGFGISVRLPGRVTPDPTTGQLTTTFANTPQVPFTDFTLKFNGGPQAALANPLACGAATTTSALTPYSGTPAKNPSSAFTVDADGKGGACPATLPFSPEFHAGTSNPLAGAFTPFAVFLSREDGQQYLSGLSVQQPPGLLGILANVPLCPEDQAAAGSCGDESKIGFSTVASGAGSAPFAISGPVSLTGPYKGAPFGLSIAVRAIAGPFDLGLVVVRAAIRVDPKDAHLVIDADPLPTILQGIPLRLKGVAVTIDRSSFLFNPTNCSVLAIGGTVTSTEGTVQQVSAPFQASGCDALPFAPKLEAKTSSKTSKSQGAGLSVLLTQKPGESNIKSVSVQLPKQFAARSDTLAGVCPDATFNAGASKCPASSEVGTVGAVTPLLRAPLGGKVYLVGHSGQLPTLEAILSGSGITLNLTSTIGLGAGISSTFAAVPDAPITRFQLDLPRGPHSALGTTADLCTGKLTIPATIVSQSGKTLKTTYPLAVSDCGVKILSAKVKGRTATLKVRVPGAGRVTFTGKGLKKATRKATKAGTFTFKVKLAKSGAARLKALERKKKKLSVKLSASFKPTKGASSKATRKLIFK
jgi:hypothetical protein